MKENAVFQFEIVSREDGEPLDALEVSLFEQHFRNLLRDAEFGFIIKDLKMIYGE